MGGPRCSREGESVGDIPFIEHSLVANGSRTIAILVPMRRETVYADTVLPRPSKSGPIYPLCESRDKDVDGMKKVLLVQYSEDASVHECSMTAVDKEASHFGSLGVKRRVTMSVPTVSWKAPGE